MNEKTPSPTLRTLDIELLAIDLTTCTRCTGSLANIEAAIRKVSEVAAATGTEIRLRKTLVASEAQARNARFVSSPTVRVEGRDLVLETRESHCDSCTELCGCAAGTTCRVWNYQGQEHDEAPVGMIVEALLREIFGAAAEEPSTGSYDLPENLRRFFAGRAAVAGAPEKACCDPGELAECCEPTAKATCCGTSVAA